MPKFECGEHFPDLDLVTKLLAPSGKCNISSPGIEVISQETACDNDDEDDVDWEWNQQVYDEKVCKLLKGQCHELFFVQSCSQSNIMSK